MICPICKRPGVTAGHILGHSKSAAKAKASAANGRKGGRPKRQHPDAVTSVAAIGRNLYRVATAAGEFEIEVDRPPKVGGVLRFD